MDYSSLKELAEAFVGRGCVNYPVELEKALRDTATTGIVRLQWSLFCPVIHYRLEQVINTAFSSGAELGKESSDMCQQLLKQLDNFDNPPFTIQRLCELIVQPKKHYRKVDIYMRAVEKNLQVVGTEEPDLAWMQNSRLQPSEKPSQEEVKMNGAHKDIDGPHSPEVAPDMPPVKKDSPPTAPTSTTWSNLREDMEEENETAARSKVEDKEGSRETTPLGTSRKRNRDNIDLENDDQFSVTVRQEADSTVNFEPPLFDPPAPLFPEPLPSKRTRECLMEVRDSGRREKMGSEGENMEEDKEREREKTLSLVSTELKTSVGEPTTEESRGGEEGRGGEGGGVTHKDSNAMLDQSGSTDGGVPGNQDTRHQASSESTCEPMITN